MSSSRSTRFGIAAAEADQNGDSAIADTNASAISGFGASTNAIAKNTAAAIDSEIIITLRRSNRSPKCPVSGERMPTTPNVSRSATDCHVAECVSFHTVNINAV